MRGTGWPRSTADTRRMRARANSLPPDAWGPALLAGTLGLSGVLLLQGVLSRLIALPQQHDLDVSRYPVLTVLVWVLMSAVVVGVVEETSFRGYLQRPVERRHGPMIAVLVSGSVFGVTHFTHPEVGIRAAAVLRRRSRCVRHPCVLDGFHTSRHGPPCWREHVERLGPFYTRSVRVAAVGRSPASHLGNWGRCGVLG